MTRLVRLLLTAGLLVWAWPAAAHPAPFSYLDLHLDASRVEGSLVIHDLDAAHDLGVGSLADLMQDEVAARYRDALVALLSPRLSLHFDSQPVTLVWTSLDVVADRLSLRLSFTIANPRPGHLSLQAHVFPYDPIHQTFINVYEDGALKHQAILDGEHRSLDYYSGTAQGRWAVVRTFVASGISHILIGPDHILFLVGLLLLGGTFRCLALIVTAFTIGHSITLSLAALDILAPPSRFVEPLIALTIVVVGADNLLVLRGAGSLAERDRGRQGRRKSAEPLRTKAEGSSLHGPPQASDIRAWLAAAFGLIHGFGFASVLKEFGLPRAALGWSLFSFNVGVEVGQLMIVLVVAGLLAWVRRRSPQWDQRATFGGSVAVILAGLYWFVQRVFRM